MPLYKIINKWDPSLSEHLHISKTAKLKSLLPSLANYFESNICWGGGVNMKKHLMPKTKFFQNV